MAWVNEISRAVSSAVFGAVSELQFDSHDKSLILENYYRMASRKTGALFALPARCIASASTREEDKDNLSEIFFKLAVAYQIKDDQCDFLGTKSGRQHSSDLKNGRPNLYHLLTNSAMSIEESFNYINDFHKSLVVDSIQLAETMPEKVRGIIKTLLIPFIEIKPLPSSNRLLPIGT